MPKKTNEEIELEKERARRKALRQGPDLERFVADRQRRFTTYKEGARIYSMSYYTFVRLAKDAGANIRIRKNVIIDLDVLDAYIEEELEGDNVNA